MDLLAAMMELQEQHGAVTDEVLHRLSRERNVPLYRLEGLRGFYPVFRAQPGPPTQVQVCRDICCAMQGGEDFPARVQQALRGARGVEVKAVSCIGRCDAAPAALVNEVPVTGSVADIAAYARGQRPLPPNESSAAPARWPTDPYSGAGERYGVLKRVLAGASGSADGGRGAVLAALKASGLRGMGGAGFPTGIKWEATRNALGDTKYIVCNADESEPGTFKDRMILERLSHLVIEAMILAGWTIGSAQGVVYLRHEYAREKKAVLRALDDARARGALGKNVFGSGFSFDIRLFVSPGSYIMGEETALLEALEDKRGEPRNKPPYPTTHGLWSKPTLMNNVETFAAIPIILDQGADWWARQGLNGCKGLKYLAVSGDVVRPGVVCVPMGTTIAQLLEQCGGVPGSKALYAFAPGGASSNFLPAAQRDVALDFQALQKAGSMLGSGAVIFVAEGRDLVELGANEVRFFRNESCGKCVPCRVGSHKAVQMIDAALAGHAQPGLIALLKDLGQTLTQTSICGLGQVALQPILSVIDNFPEAASRRLEPKVKAGASVRRKAAARGPGRPRTAAAAAPSRSARAKAKPGERRKPTVPKTAVRKPVRKVKAAKRGAAKSRAAKRGAAKRGTAHRGRRG